MREGEERGEGEGERGRERGRGEGRGERGRGGGGERGEERRGGDLLSCSSSFFFLFCGIFLTNLDHHWELASLWQAKLGSVDMNFGTLPAAFLLLLNGVTLIR